MELVLTIVREHWLKPNRKACIDKINRRNRRIMGQIILSDELNRAPKSVWSLPPISRFNKGNYFDDIVFNFIIRFNLEPDEQYVQRYQCNIYDDIVFYFKIRFNLEPDSQWVHRYQCDIYEKLKYTR
jgi:hypothetical protein